MKLPAGTDGGTITNPQEEGLTQYLQDFRGAIEIDTPSGHGFIITENGNLIAAYFRNRDGAFRGKAALSHMISESGGGRFPPVIHASEIFFGRIFPGVPGVDNGKSPYPGKAG